ncbi:hypothetical protein Tco_1510012 [Tanacetum coccineum]
MSDSEDSTVTYTEVSSLFEDLSDIGSPRLDGLPIMPKEPYAYVVAAFQALPSLDYVPGPEEPEQAPPSPEFVPELVYPEFIPPEDEVFLAEEPPLPAVSSDDESSDDDEDDDDDDVEEDEDEEEEEHPALADSVPPPVYRVARLLAIPTPPPSPLSPLSSPLPHILSPLPQILSSPLPVSPPPLPASPTYLLGYRAAMIRLRAETPSTSHPLPSSTPPSRTPSLLPIPLPTPSPPMRLPSIVCRAGVFEVTLLPRKRLCFAQGPRYESRLIVHLLLLLDPLEALEQTIDLLALWMMRLAAATDVAELSQQMTDFVMTIRQDMDEIYGRLDDAQDDRLLMSDYSASTVDGDCRVAGNRPYPTGTTCGDTNTDEDTTDIGDSTPESWHGSKRQSSSARELHLLQHHEMQTLYFKGTEGVIELTQWFERMETVFRVSNCSVENQIKFSTCTLLGCALTGGTPTIRQIGHDVVLCNNLD